MVSELSATGLAALSHADQEYSVFPVYGVKDGICLCRDGPQCESSGKHPMPRSGFHAATTDRAQIRKWWKRTPEANVGIPTGDGLFVLDVDSIESLHALETEHGELPETLTVRTGSGGLHYYFKTSQTISSSAGKVAPGIDVRANGGYVVAPPSTHESGGTYTIETEAPLADLPSFLATLATSPQKGVSKVAPSSIPGGQRNSTLFREACRIRRIGLAQDEGLAAVLAMNGSRCDPPLAESEVDRLVRSAFLYEANVRESLTDAGNARRLAQLAQGRLLFVKRLGGWLIYENGRWTRDELNSAQELAKEIALELYHEASVTDDPTDRKALRKWAVRSEDRARIEAMLKLAESIPQLVALADDFDQDPWILNVLNGVLDLRTGELMSHDPKYRITRLAPIEWLGPDTPCPMWEEHIRFVLGGDEPLVQFLQRALGYSLTGLTTEQKLFVLHGLGANGKSVTLEVLRRVAGNYAAHTPAESLMVKRGGSTNDIARLRGARLVTAVESELESRLAEVLIKQITGGDKVTARFLYREFFEFRPTFSIWLAVNHRPAIHGTDHAIWRRICLIPFEETIPRERRDPGMASKLSREGPGILAWLVRGCLAWKKDGGLREPLSVERATEQYREEQDPVGVFLSVCCVEKKGASVESGDLHRAYTEWACDVGEDPVAPNRFGQMLAERGFKKDRKGPKKATRWLGLKLGKGLPEGPIF